MTRSSAGVVKPHGAPSRRSRAGELLLWVVRSALWVTFTSVGTALNMWAAVVLLLLLAPSSLWGYIGLLFGAGLAGGLGGAVIGFGQALALRRWLDGAASLGSFFSTVLASSTALGSGTVAGWWVYTSAGDLAGAFSGVVVYGCVFGLLQRPMLDYMAQRSHFWIPANAAAVLLGAAAVLAAFDVSGGRRDMLQFRYAGLAYSLAVGAAFLWMTRQVRGATALEQKGQVRPEGQPEVGTPWALEGRDAAADPALLEIHEHRVYRVYVPSAELRTGHAGDSAAPPLRSDRGASAPDDGEGGPDVIDATYRVIS